MGPFSGGEYTNGRRRSGRESGGIRRRCIENCKRQNENLRLQSLFRQGGELFEITKSGEKHIWGTIQDWSPPGELTFSWHPGRAPATAQVITVSFQAQDDGTRVTLTHGGWETLGDAAAETREGYVQGWDIVLGQLFVNECAKIVAD
ncbi:MAG: SRPBCC domain-containing protein [Candidatus Marinimicrobia bacterium]|nr:SRPBCC domain-containing protein [Candidatus Neomarinimicrobiota bacterium]